MTRPRPLPRCAQAFVVGALTLLTVVVAGATPATAQPVDNVTVERVRPKQDKVATLRFLTANRDFIRARYDLLRQTPGGGSGSAGVIDPRFLAYQAMLRDVFAARDSVAAADDSLGRRQLLASITELGDLEQQLDLMDRLLSDQRTRLGVLQQDFTGRQQTALMVVVSGYPSSAAVSRIAITLEDGDTLTIPLSEEHRAALQRGGVVEVFHGFIEPRAQVVEVAIAGDRWPAGDRGFIRLDPARDRLTLLRLDLSTVQPDRGAASIQANTWLHDAGLHPGGG